MKTKFLIFVLTLFSYTFVNGQDYYKNLDEKARVYTEEMVTVLDLTDNQEALIHRQNLAWIDQQTRYEKLDEKTDQYKRYLESYRQDYVKNVNNALTDDQRVAFKEWLEKTKLLKD